MNPRGFVGRICLPFCWVPWSSSTCSGLESGAEGRAPPPPQRRFTGAHSGLDPTVAWTPSGLDPQWPGPHHGLDPTVAWTPPWSGPTEAWTHSGLDPQWPGPHRGLDPTWPGPTVVWTPSGLDPGAGPDGCGVGDSSLGSAFISSFKTMDLGSQAADIVWLSELWLSLISAQAYFRPLSNQISGSSPVSSSTSFLFTCWTPHTFLCSCV